MRNSHITHMWRWRNVNTNKEKENSFQCESVRNDIKIDNRVYPFSRKSCTLPLDCEGRENCRWVPIPSSRIEEIELNASRKNKRNWWWFNNNNQRKTKNSIEPRLSYGVIHFIILENAKKTKINNTRNKTNRFFSKEPPNQNHQYPWQ